MKKIFSFLTVALLAVLVLASCGLKHTVSFLDDETLLSTVEVVDGETVVLPQDPTKEGLTFAGWCVDPNCITAFDSTTPITEDTTLYAKWAVKLTFNTNGGSAMDPIIAKGGSVYELPANPVKEGYAFVGWYTDAAFTTELPALVFPRTNTTAYAKWRAFDQTTKVEFSGFESNDADAFVVDGNKFTATETKGEWTMVATTFEGNYAGYDTVVMKVVGTKDINILLKFQDGGIAAAEQQFTMTGEEQELIWTFPATTLENSGQGTGKFGWFLNPGVAGAGAYVTIKSCTLYRTLEDGSENTASSIIFNSNKGSLVSPIFAEIGSQVSAPEAPTKEGFIFGGWYSDAECTQAYEFTTMPQTSITLYAKWDKATVDPISTNMLADTFTPNACCSVTQENGVLVVKKNEGSPYEAIWSTLSIEEAVKGMNILKVEFQGAAGQEVIFKVGDHWTCEKKVTCTGYVQYIEYEFDLSEVPAANKALIIMPGVHADGATGEVIITHLEFANYPSKVDMLADTYTPNACCTVTQENGVLVVKKNEGSPYEAIWSTFTVEEVVKPFGILKAEFQGAAGQEIIFKVGDYWACEKKVTCTGEVQYIEFAFDLTDVPAGNKALIIMPGVHADGATGEVTITRLEFASQYDPCDAKAGWVENDNGSYVISNADGVLTITKNATWGDNIGTEWCFVKNVFEVEEGKYDTLVVEFTGDVANQEIIFNFNGTEAKPFTNGEAQQIEIKLNAKISAADLKIFVNAGQPGSCNLVITEMYLK